MKKFYGTIAFIASLMLLGTVGANECDTIGLKQFIIQSVILMALMFTFAKLAGAFDHNEL